ncbi:MAG TPA: VOC family protein [Edaphocola sp.]|nr:VOC family protein [Edaphocola sp.]
MIKMEKKTNAARFAPELHIPNGTCNIDFYTKFGAKEHFCFRNDDGSIHVAEPDIDGSVFHLHETVRWPDALEPAAAKGVMTVIGLFVDDVPEAFNRALSAGATEISPVTDHDYGYRQGIFKGPFGHYWQIQKKISQNGPPEGESHRTFNGPPERRPYGRMMSRSGYDHQPQGSEHLPAAGPGVPENYFSLSLRHALPQR